ncbi:MAG: amidohydrolase family protein [Henriciella sp.]
MNLRTICSLPLMLIALSCAAIASPDETEVEPDEWTIIHAGTLIAEPGKSPKSRQTIIVKNDRIDRIASGYKSASDLPDANDAKVIDLKSSYVMPGLMDAHVHLGLGGEFGQDRPSERGKDTYRLLDVQANAAKTLEAGFTTIRNVGSYDWAVFAMRDAVKAGDVIGPRIFSAGHTIEIGTFSSMGSGACYDVTSCRKAVRRQIDMGADWIKVYTTCSGSKPCGREFAPAVFLEDELQTVIDTAASFQIPVAAHAHGTDGINKAIKAGARSVEHGSYNNEESRRLWIENSAYYVPTLAVQDNIIRDYETAGDDMKPVMEGFMAEHPKRVAAAHEAGVQIAAGSDAGVVPHGENANELIWYVKIGMTEAEALRAATVVNAELLKKEDELGTIEAGKYADIIAMDTNPLEDIEALKDITFVMAAGNVAKHDHERE